MKRTAGWLITLAAASGCVATDSSYYRGPMGHGGMTSAPAMAGAVGPWGEPVGGGAAMASMPPHAMAAQMGMPPEVFQATMMGQGGQVMQAHYMAGMAAGGIVPAQCCVGGGMGAGMGGGAGNNGGAYVTQRTQVRFAGPAGAKIGWHVATGGQGVATHMMDVPSRFNFLQASIYRLKLSDIPGRQGLELYPTIEVVPSNAKTDAFLAHNYVPVEFSDEDFDQVMSGNFITKVIYLPDAAYQSQAVGGPEEISSTRLEPGVDPIAEAQRRGHILLIIRVGGIDLEARNTPPLSAPADGGALMDMPVMPNMPMPPAPVMPAGHVSGSKPRVGLLNSSTPVFPQTAIPVK